VTALPQNAALLVIDVQKGFDRYNEEYHRNNPQLEANIARLQRAWRETGRPMCVSTTARMAGNLGFTTYVVSDATATFDNMGPDGKRYGAELLHDVALADLHGEFATVVDTATILARASEEAA